MADVNALLAQAAGINESTQKQTQVAQAAAQKQEALGTQQYAAPKPADYRAAAAGMGNNLGMASAPQAEQDLRTMQPSQLIQRYGETGAGEMLRRAVDARNDFSSDRTFVRRSEDVVADSITDVGLGVANAIGGIGALGAGVVNENAGQWAASQLQNLNEFATGTQSDALNARRRANEATGALRERDSTAQYERERATDGEVISGLRRIGRDVLGAIENASDDSAILGSGIAQGVGSLAAAGPIARGLTGAASLAGRGVGAAASKGAVPAAIGLMEGGGAYQQSVNQVMEMSLEQLAQSSPMFRELVSEGVSPEEARVTVANRTGLLSAGIQAPLAAAAGTLVSRFEGAPMAVPSVRTAAGNLIRETLEEGIQSGTGQTAQNIATQALANDTQSISEGVGRQIGEGALYGLGTAGVVQAPGAAVQGTLAAARGAVTTAMAGVGAATSWLDGRLAAQQRATDAESPVADAAVAEAAAQVAQDAPAAMAEAQAEIDASDAAPEVKAQQSRQLQGLMEAATLPSDLTQVGLSAEGQQLIQGSATRVEAAQRLADLMGQVQEGGAASAILARDMLTLLDPVNARVEDSANELANVDSNSQVGKLMESFSSLLNNIHDSPKIARALASAQQEIMAEAASLAPIQAADLNTSVGQEQAAKVIVAVQVDPLSVPAATVRSVLEATGNSGLMMTPTELASLRQAHTLLMAQDRLLQEKERLGLTTARDIVSKQVLTAEEGFSKENAPSAMQHSQGIVSAMRAGNSDLAAARLADFGQFVNHMINKVDAINDSFALRDQNDTTVTFPALDPASREFVADRGKIFVQPRSLKSVSTAQAIALEAETLGDVFNGIADAFPELGFEHLSVPPLVSDLVGNAAEVAAKFVAEKRPGGRSAPRPTSNVTRPAQEPSKENIASRAQESAEDAVSNSPTQNEVDELVRQNRMRDEEAPVETPTPSPAPAAPTPAPQPAAEAVAPVSAPVEQPVAVEEPPEVQVDHQENLVNGENNYFRSAFRAPSTNLSRLADKADPIAFVQQALASVDAMDAATGTKNPRGYEVIAPAMAGYLADLNTVKDAVVGQLDAFLNKRSKRSAKGNGRSNRERVLAGEGFRWPNGKVLNILDNVDGQLSYNTQLLDGALLASKQWLLDSVGGRANLDAGDVASIFSLDEATVGNALVDATNKGMSQQDAVSSLGSKIQTYWGTRTNRNAAEGFTKGIPQAMAAEILTALQTQGDITVETISVDAYGNILTGEEGEAPVHRRHNRVLINEQLNKDTGLFAVPNAIDRVVLVEPEQRYYFGDARPRVPDFQGRSTTVPTTDEQKAAIRNLQNTPFRMDPGMTALFIAMGETGVRDYMGYGDASPSTPMNENHRRSMDGRITNVVGAHQEMMRLLANMRAEGDASGSSFLAQPVYYAYNYTGVNRLQMVGRSNPQASKLMREVMLPTWSNLDLANNAEHRDSFMLALGQAFGEKVHNQDLAVTKQKVQALIDGPLRPAIDTLKDFFLDANLEEPELSAGRISQGMIGAIRQAMSDAGVGTTFVALHALMEQARLETMDPSSLGSFDTSLYVEADGVTNGVMNAMTMMSAGAFNANQLKSLEKGGLFVGKVRTMNEHASYIDSQDNYKASADFTKVNANNLFKNIEGQAKDVLGNLNFVMQALMPGFEVTESGDYTVPRNMVKNPMMTTVYGSGAAGIAANMARDIVDAFYEQVSLAMQAAEGDPTVANVTEVLFSDIANRMGYTTSEFVPRFNAALNSLVSGYVRQNAKGEYFYKAREGSRARSNSWETMTFSSDQMENLRDNLVALFVRPLRAGIEEAVGRPFMDQMALLRQATQAQSVMLANAYRKEIDALMERKKIDDPEWNRSEFLSLNEQQQAMDTVLAKYPMVSTGTQNFLLAKTQSVDIGSDAFGASLTQQWAGTAEMGMPANIGVGALPILVIGSGDGQMVQNIFAGSDAPEGALPIFDGVHYRLDRIKEYSTQTNKAVYDSWMRNPIADVLRSYQTFMRTSEFSDLRTNPELLMGMSNIFRRELGLSKDQAASPEDIQAMLQEIEAELVNSAASITARQDALKRIGVTVDQMAAAASPYNNGMPMLDAAAGRDLENVAQILNGLMQDPARTLTTEQRAEEQAVVADANVVMDNAVTRGNVSNLSITGLTRVANDKRLAPGLSLVLKQALKTLPRDYKITIGSLENLMEYTSRRGFYTMPENELRKNRTRGFTVPEENSIYLIESSPEVLVHEVVHATTYNTILDWYRNPENSRSSDVTQSISSMEQMMEDFLNIDQKDFDVREAVYVRHAQSVIQSALLDRMGSPESKAKALNEFMAWGLTQPEVSAVLGRTEVSPLVRMAKSVIQAIKKLFWGRQHAPKVADDVLSNLQFHTAVVMRAQPSIAQAQGAGILQAQGLVGDSERLAAIDEALQQKVTELLPTDRVSSRMAQHNAIMVSHAFQAAGFNMNDQERSVFNRLVAVLGTSLELDPNVLARAQELFMHASKNLKVESFMANPESTEPADRYYAQQKYDLVMGKTGLQDDSFGRTTLLPSFMALSMTNPEFREILAQMSVPRREVRSGTNMDTILENAGNRAMDALGDKFSGQGNAKTIQQAMDNLGDRLRETIQEQESQFEMAMGKSNEAINAVNDKVTEGIDRVATNVIDWSNRVALNPKASKGERAVAAAARISASLATDAGTEAVSESIRSAMNRTKAWTPFRELVTDLIGRTGSNAKIYDMIKLVRSMVQQNRQNYREHVPATIKSKFKTQLSNEQWNSLHRSVGRTDLVSLLNDGMPVAEALQFVESPAVLRSKISSLENEIKGESGNYWKQHANKAKQLANYMVTGEAGSNLLRNAEAVSRLLGERGIQPKMSPGFVKKLDQLITLYAVQELSAADRSLLSSLVQPEAEGLAFLLHYLEGQRRDETDRIQREPNGLLNSYKGYVPTKNAEGLQIIVADDSEYTKLRERSFTRVGAYQGSSVDGNRSRGYYFSATPGRGIYNQGVVQNVRQTAGGVDVRTGFSYDRPTAGRIVDKQAVERISAAIASGRERATNEPLLPVFGANGQVVAYERALDPKMLGRLQAEQHSDLANMVGVWRGRQVEEAQADEVNNILIDHLHKLWVDDLKQSKSNQSEYINLLDPKLKDPILKDAVSLFSNGTREQMERRFGEDTLWVRKDMLNDVVGYRSPTVGDAWTGNTRWSPEAQRVAKNLAMSIFGNDAYQKFTNAERVVQNVVGDARVLIVVKSVIVPVGNLLSNILQMSLRGVPLMDIARGMPRKTMEIDSYVKTTLRKVEAEAELRAAVGNPLQERKLQTEIAAIEDSHKRMTIWPLIQAGEFSSITDIGMTREEIELTSGRLNAYMENLVNKLPEGVRNLGRYAVITKDTALYQGLQKSVQYGDFLAKAVMYDDLTKRKGMSSADALAMITEEFVNYDRLPGRFRGYLENTGLLWFYNFKIRSVKVAASIMRNNPVQALLSGAAGAADLMPLGQVGTPLSDNLFSKMGDGALSYSMGPGMGINSPFLNPWWNLTQ